MDRTCGYWPVRSLRGALPSSSSKSSSTYSSSRSTSIRAGDQPRAFVAETAERTSRGRTSRRQGFVFASVGVGLRRFVFARAAGPETRPAPRSDDLAAGDFRREGIGAPRVDGSPAALTASRSVSFVQGTFAVGKCGFPARPVRRGYRFRVCHTQNVIRRAARAPIPKSLKRLRAFIDAPFLFSKPALDT